VKEKIMMTRCGLMLCMALVVGATLIVGLATAADKAAEKTPITPAAGVMANGSWRPR
jgi:hypothetical protein